MQIHSPGCLQLAVESINQRQGRQKPTNLESNSLTSSMSIGNLLLDLALFSAAWNYRKTSTFAHVTSSHQVSLLEVSIPYASSSACIHLPRYTCFLGKFVMKILIHDGFFHFNLFRHQYLTLHYIRIDTYYQFGC